MYLRRKKHGNTNQLARHEGGYSLFFPPSTDTMSGCNGGGEQVASVICVMTQEDSTSVRASLDFDGIESRSSSFHWSSVVLF
jgi:hypothetical protein